MRASQPPTRLLNAVRRRAKHLLALLGGLLWGHTLCMHETLLDLLTACLNSSSGHCVSCKGGIEPLDVSSTVAWAEPLRGYLLARPLRQVFDHVHSSVRVEAGEEQLEGEDLMPAHLYHTQCTRLSEKVCTECSSSACTV